MSTPAAMASEPISLHGLTFDVAGMSEQGPRSENQDAFSLDRFADASILAVADGMGGERSGRLAADTALGALLTAAPIRSVDDARRAVRSADMAVAQAAEEDPEQRGGMGCALAFLSLVAPRTGSPGWVGAHVGDVRILSRSPDGVLRLETRDHTPAFARWEAGEIALDDVPDTPGANRLQRAVGRGGEADALWVPLRPGWTYLLISDGVSKAMRLDELEHALASPSSAAACELIRQKVEERGPDDNYTAVVARVLNGTSSAAPAGQHSAPPRRQDPMPSAPPPPRRSAGIIVVGLLALLALLAAGAALWMVRDAEQRVVNPAEVERLRTEVDSLRARVADLEEPFGPEVTTPLPLGTPTQP